MESFWMTHVGPNPNDKGPYKRHTEEKTDEDTM